MGLQKLNGPVYSNCSIYHPDGTLMCRCSRKKINWYLKKGIATALNENDIQLNFTPGGKGWAKDSFYLEHKEDRCVVCGSTDNLTKHHVVPYQYRKHMGYIRKTHSHFDVLCVCINCHDEYEVEATKFNMDLAKRYGIDFCSPLSNSEKLDIKAKSYYLALKNHGHKIPDERKNKMLGLISCWYGKSIEMEDLYSIDTPEIKIKEIQKPGKRILDSWLSDNDLQSFVVMWRDHFIQHTNPKYLSEYWINEYKTRIY